MRTELVEALGRIVGPRWVRHRSAELVTYAADGLPTHESVPGLVVLPGSKQEVAAVLRLLNLLEVPFVARGAGTGLSGGALAERNAVLVTLTRMNRILAVWPERRRAVVRTGGHQRQALGSSHRTSVCTISPTHPARAPAPSAAMSPKMPAAPTASSTALRPIMSRRWKWCGRMGASSGWAHRMETLGPGHRRSLRRERRNVRRSGRDHGSPGGDSPPGTHDIRRLSGAALLPAKPSQRSSPPASSRRRSK